MLALYSYPFISFASMPPSHASCPDNSISDPPIPGVLQGKGSGQGHVLLAMAPDYPPYTQLTATVPKDLGGFSVDIGHALEAVCGVKVEFILDSWSECWTTKPERITFSEVREYVGEGILNGRVHGCTGYTHTKGERGLSLEFTDSILGKLKTAGILTRLDNGVPFVSPLTTDYTNIKLGDVSGWAPTPDTFAFNFNYCDGGNQFLPPANISKPLGGDGNTHAIKGLLDGEYDALYMYADQLYNFVNSNDPNADGFGTTFAYIHTGLDQWSINGTTLAISKRGSGLKQVLDPCIAALVKTQTYQDICTKYFDASSCINNPAAASGSLFYDNKMNERTDAYACADGYCTCSASSA